MKQRAEQAEPRQRRGCGIDRAGAPACHDVVRHEPEREGRQQLDEPAGKPGKYQPHQVRARALQGEPQQVARLRAPRRKGAIEHPGFVLQRSGALRRDPRAAPADRVDFPVAPERSRQQRDRLAVFGAERQQGVAVAPPPLARLLEPHAPGAHAGRIENVDEADRRIGRPRAGRNPEIDSPVAADYLEGVRQSRVLVIAIPLGRPVVDVEEPLPRRLLGRAAAGDPGALEIRIVDHGKPAVEALQGEGDSVKGGERRQQQALPHQRLGRRARHLRLAQEREPARPRQRDGGFVSAARPCEFRLVDHVHEEARAA